jgi:hypothetical protein
MKDCSNWDAAAIRNDTMPAEWVGDWLGKTEWATYFDLSVIKPKCQMMSARERES